ncbi:MAG: ethanolamine ammonia-lyase reactivating factor EutA [Proteobacteria bacterium]|nr:ethanolamine ammonia-lyase reactivating factor EutA [Pseudomonadota bacterium]
MDGLSTDGKTNAELAQALRDVEDHQAADADNGNRKHECREDIEQQRQQLRGFDGDSLDLDHRQHAVDGLLRIDVTDCCHQGVLDVRGISACPQHDVPEETCLAKRHIEGGTFRTLRSVLQHVVDDTDRLIRLEPAGADHARRAGFSWDVGDVATDAELQQVAEQMADAVVAALLADPLPADVAELYLTDRIGDLSGVDGVMFSGGVAEYVYDRETARFGDLGLPLGRALRSRVDSGALPWRLLPAGECIRATALGASEYSVQLSGNTGWISDPDVLLPRRNLQVVRPVYDLGDEVDAQHVCAAVRRHLVSLDADASDQDVALALSWQGPPSHERLLPFARGVRDALAERIAAARPVYVMLDGDVAMTLGRLLREELGELSQLFVYTVALGVHFVVNDVALREHHREAYDRIGRWIIASATCFHSIPTKTPGALNCCARLTSAPAIKRTTTSQPGTSTFSPDTSGCCATWYGRVPRHASANSGSRKRRSPARHRDALINRLLASRPCYV